MDALAPGVDIREHREAGGTLVLSVSGALNLKTAPEFAERMAGSTSPRWAVVLDLDELEFMDSGGLGVLLAATDRARRAGCSVSLAPPRGRFLRLFRSAGLENVLPLRSEPVGGTPPRVRSRFARIAGRG